MKIKDRPFSQLSKDDILRPWLPVVIINPHTDKKMRVLALIDTGADECALPASYAAILGHTLNAGKIKKLLLFYL
ncbi:MAG: hypothetical protein AB1349_09665 [Elusimicrobiota bacterium]